MKKSAIAVAASAIFGAGSVLTAPIAVAQPENTATPAEAEDIARRLGHGSVEAAVAAGDMVKVEGGYALTAAGLSAAKSAGLLVSPALIPIAVGFGVAIVGIGIVAVADDDSESGPAVDDDDDDDDDGGPTDTPGSPGSPGSPGTPGDGDDGGGDGDDGAGDGDGDDGAGDDDDDDGGQVPPTQPPTQNPGDPTDGGGNGGNATSSS